MALESSLLGFMASASRASSWHMGIRGHMGRKTPKEPKGSTFVTAGEASVACAEDNT